VSAPYSGVGAQFFDDEDTGVRGYVSASYVGGKVGVYRFPDRDGGLAEPSQVLVMNTTHVGPVVERQDKSYLHDVILDPTRAFLLMTDLGQDRVRVFRYHKQDIAPLVELAPLITPPGCGPRKAVFWTKKETGEVFLFVNGELDQRVYSYRVEYKQGGLEWCLVGSVVSVSEELPKTTAPTSGIAVTVSFLCFLTIWSWS
jgi:6-phosphogluconolactonase (cycloisomerase 2 family)